MTVRHHITVLFMKTVNTIVGNPAPILPANTQAVMHNIAAQITMVLYPAAQAMQLGNRIVVNFIAVHRGYIRRQVTPGAAVM